MYVALPMHKRLILGKVVLISGYHGIIVNIISHSLVRLE